MSADLNEIERIQEEIDRLPKGNITYKTIRGRRRMYLQWTENGAKKSMYIKAADEQITTGLIAKRKMLEEERRNLLMEYGTLPEGYLGQSNLVREDTPGYGAFYNGGDRFRTRVVTGNELSALAGSVSGFGKRECYESLHRFLFSEGQARVCLIYGLRRTGKTVMLFQAISELPKAETVYIKMMTSDNMGTLNEDLRRLSVKGVKYVFIDEITLMKDFIESASLLSDIYAASGMKIVLSGTDSLGFMLSMDDELYDRAIAIHTTFIPFREYARLLNIHDIDEYIRYGGTLRLGETDFDNDAYSDEGLAFRDDESTRKYIDTSIARNIQHSLECYKLGGHFRHLIDLYEKSELTSAINRLIEDMNHRFVLSVLTRDFESHDLGSARQLERKRAAASGKKSVLEDINVHKVTDRLREILDIRNRNEMSVEVTDDHVTEIRQYLKLLDLIVDCPTRTIGSGKEIERIIFTQPGMRFCQAQALVYSLMKDELFMQYPVKERSRICNRILEEVKGRMLEDIVIMETAMRLPKWKKVFKLEFAIGEFDMVIQDEKDLTCEIYEIKHSSEIADEQFKNLIDEDKCKEAEFQFGDIISRNVIYRGPDRKYKGINYINALSYLEDNANVSSFEK